MKNLQINQDTIGPQEYSLVEKNGGGGEYIWKSDYL